MKFFVVLVLRAVLALWAVTGPLEASAQGTPAPAPAPAAAAGAPAAPSALTAAAAATPTAAPPTSMEGRRSALG